MTNLERVTADIREKLPRMSKIEVPHILGVYWESPKPMLNDVLEWLHNKYETYRRHTIDTYGHLNINYRYSYGDEVVQMSSWDLSKPYLKDQSNELIDYLAGLI